MSAATLSRRAAPDVDAALPTDDEPTPADLRRIELQHRYVALLHAADHAEDEDTLGAYLRELPLANRPLTLPQQRAAALRGDRNALISSVLPLVIALAKEVLSSARQDAPWCHYDLEELVAAGNVGLARAAAGYDARRGFAFATYATFWVRKYLWWEAWQERRHSTVTNVTLSALVADGRDIIAPDLVLPASPETRPTRTYYAPLYQRSQRLRVDLAALQRARLLDASQITLLVLLTGAGHPDARWTPPDRWCVGLAHSQRAVADLLGMHHTTVSRRLAVIEAHLYHITQQRVAGSPEAQHLLEALVEPLPKVRLFSPAAGAEGAEYSDGVGTLLTLPPAPIPADPIPPPLEPSRP